MLFSLVVAAHGRPRAPAGALGRARARARPLGAALVAAPTREEMQQAALEVIVPLLEGPGVGVLCLIEDGSARGGGS